jgi:hypothetical protein
LGSSQRQCQFKFCPGKVKHPLSIQHIGGKHSGRPSCSAHEGTPRTSVQRQSHHAEESPHPPMLISPMIAFLGGIGFGRWQI